MKLKEFLDQNHPGINEALVCKSIGEKYSEFLLIEKHKISNGELYIINSHIYSDYDFLWEETGPWEICWKSK